MSHSVYPDKPAVSPHSGKASTVALHLPEDPTIHAEMAFDEVNNWFRPSFPEGPAGSETNPHKQRKINKHNILVLPLNKTRTSGHEMLTQSSRWCSATKTIVGSPPTTLGLHSSSPLIQKTEDKDFMMRETLERNNSLIVVCQTFPDSLGFPLIFVLSLD
ncbi:hypothetical protein RRG08_029950 [Elysia crispata]|uniref:Uncharacterized protein n=1 Tax=Elysia crispata TaxID=231223 RepID=A0AAE1DHT1_9GAST|nr:hypothetical protein RRG08_029950 [Elysia crispata]